MEGEKGVGLDSKVQVSLRIGVSLGYTRDVSVPEEGHKVNHQDSIKAQRLSKKQSVKLP